MPRAYETVIPPEYKIMATQVTQYGEPVTQQITPSAYGSYGRAPQDPNDMHQQGMGPEVWMKNQSPSATARARANSYVAELKHLTRTGQIQTPEVNEREGGAKVVYRKMTTDDQVSNVRGLQVTGDPKTLSQALKSAGNSSFEQKMPLDVPRARASMHRAIRSMPAEQREAFQEVLALKGPEAFESIAPSALAGLNIENVGSTPSGFVTPKLPPKQLPAQTKKTTAKKVRPMVKLPTQLPKTAALKKVIPPTPRDEGSHPVAFDKLVAEASAKQENGASKGLAKFHPAQSNFQDPTGQTNTTSPKIRSGVTVSKQLQDLKQVAKSLKKADEKISRKQVDLTKAWAVKKKQAEQAQAQGNSAKATRLLSDIQKLQQGISNLKAEQGRVKQGVTAIQQDVIKAASSGEISEGQKQDIIIQLPTMGGGSGGGSSIDPGFYTGQGVLPGVASDDGMSTVGEDGYPDPTGPYLLPEGYGDFLDGGMKMSTKLFIGGGLAAAIGVGIYAFMR